MILEGIVTTVNADGSPNIAPMGPQVEPDFRRFALKPYPTSNTYQNLKRTGQGVLHVTDDVLLLARAAVGVLDPLPAMSPATLVEGQILADACRWYEFRLHSLDDAQERVRIECEVVHQGRIRDFFGFNRAKHAVVEAAILATRTAFLPAAEILAEFQRLAVLVDKTGGPQEHAAYEMLLAHVRRATASG